MVPLALWLQCPIWYFLCFAQQLSLPLGCSQSGCDSPAFLISPKSKPNLQSKVNNWPVGFLKNAFIWWLEMFCLAIFFFIQNQRLQSDLFHWDFDAKNHSQKYITAWKLFGCLTHSEISCWKMSHPFSWQDLERGIAGLLNHSKIPF